MMVTMATATGVISRRGALRAGVGAGIGLAASAALAGAGAAQDGTPTSVEAAEGFTSTRTVLTLDGAAVMVEGARGRAEELGVPMVIVIVDESGELKAFARMDGAGVASIDLATGKAYTAAAFRSPTSALAERLGGDPARIASFTAMPNVVLLGGGLPIRVEDSVIGGIGVGGGSPEQDEEVAQAGIDALAPA